MSKIQLAPILVAAAMALAPVAWADDAQPAAAQGGGDQAVDKAGQVVSDKAQRQSDRVTSKVDQATDQATDKAVDSVLDKALDKLFGR